jgi:beta-mannosidase
MRRIATKDPGYLIRSYETKKDAVRIWAVTTSINSCKVLLKVRAFDIESGESVSLNEKDRIYKLVPNRTTELIKKLDIPKAESTVVVAYLESVSNKSVIWRYVSWQSLTSTSGLQILRR